MFAPSSSLRRNDSWLPIGAIWIAKTTAPVTWEHAGPARAGNREVHSSVPIEVGCCQTLDHRHDRDFKAARVKARGKKDERSAVEEGLSVVKTTSGRRIKDLRFSYEGRYAMLHRR